MSAGVVRVIKSLGSDIKLIPAGTITIAFSQRVKPLCTVHCAKHSNSLNPQLFSEVGIIPISLRKNRLKEIN